VEGRTDTPAHFEDRRRAPGPHERRRPRHPRRGSPASTSRPSSRRRGSISRTRTFTRMARTVRKLVRSRRTRATVPRFRRLPPDGVVETLPRPTPDRTLTIPKASSRRHRIHNPTVASGHGSMAGLIRCHAHGAVAQVRRSMNGPRRRPGTVGLGPSARRPTVRLPRPCRHGRRMPASSFRA